MTPLRKSFRLTPEIVTAFAGSPVVCLYEKSIGQTFRLYTDRPSADLNLHPIVRDGAVVVDPTGTVEGNGDEDTEAPLPITIVRIEGPIEQRAGYHDECGGWSDGHDAIAERMIAALEETDVLLVIDSPGGAHAGLEQAVERVKREKMEHGRRVTVYADEMIGSAAYWWAACIGDEIYAPPSAIVGSIGARASHASMAGALLKEGVEVTYFAWPNEGKVAFAPELPLSDLGKQRGERDTSIAGESFAAAIGPYRGMSREEIVELSADALSGDMAVSAKLIDSVASFEDVLDYCIAQAERAQNSPEVIDPYEEDRMSDTNQNTGSRVMAGTVGLAAPAVRAEKDPKDPDGDPEKMEGKQPDGICKNCGHQMRNEAKYCDQCGESMEAQPLEDEEEDPDHDGDRHTEGDKPEGEDRRAEEEEDRRAEEGEPKPGEKKMGQPPPPMKETKNSYTNLLGLRRGASDLAIKSALVRKLQVVDFVSQITGAVKEDEMIGELRSLREDAAESGKLRASTARMRREANEKERLELLTRLSNLGLPDYPRGNLLIDEVDANGRVISVKPAPAYAEMKIGTLRGLVQGKVRNAAPIERSPFVSQPDPQKAEQAYAQGVFSSQVQSAKNTKPVQRAVASGIDPDVAAGIYAREFGGK